jgi:hypothetical protein
MASKPFIKVDLSQWDATKPNFLEIQPDNDPASADLRLDGAALLSNTSYLYSFVLQPGFAYRFDVSTQFSGVHAFLTLSGTNDVLWANPTGLGSLSANRMPMPNLTVDVPTEVTLTVFNPADQLDATFNVTILTNPGGSAGEPPLPIPPFLPTDNNIFRFTQVSNGQYFYTASTLERDVLEHNSDFRLDGPVFRGDDQPREGYIPVYRFLIPTTKSYFFTASEEERRQLTAPENKYGFGFEGAAFFVPAAPTAETIPVYSLQNLNTLGVLLTANPIEKAFALLSGDWFDRHVTFNALPVDPELSDSLDVVISGVELPEPL